MRKPLNWAFLSPFKKESASRMLRHRLAMTTILAVAPFLGYGRQAYADCEPAAAPLTHLCSGSGPSSGQFLFVNDANFATAGDPPYVVTTGLGISGAGNQRFTDNYASTSITNDTYYGRGLSVVSTGDIGQTPGAVTIFTNGTISGTAHGIHADNRSSGALIITANGTVTGVDIDEPGDPGPDTFIRNDGIYARNFGSYLTITTGAGSTVTGEHNGIDARNYGTGDLTITTNGDVTSYEHDGIFARNGDPFSQENTAQNLTVNINAESVVDGAKIGLQAQNYGAGELKINVDGSVTGQGYDGLYARNEGTNLIITTSAGSLVKGNQPPVDPEDPEAIEDSNGIDARNYGSGYLKITANGEVFGNLNDAIFARNYGTDLTIETGDQSLIRGGGNGIGAYNFGNGNLTITAKGVVGGYSEDGDGIHALNVSGEYYNPDTQRTYTGSGKNLIITTDADSDVFGGKDGIDADNFGTGFLSITAEGKVTGLGLGEGEGGDGIRAYNSANGGSDEDGSALTITTGSASAVYGLDDGIQAENLGAGDLTITANGTVTGQYGNGISAINDYGPLYDSEYQQIGFAQGNNLTITTGAASAVTGNGYGIFANNQGTGNTTITAKGQVTGRYQDGIYALDGSEGGDMTITTATQSVITGGSHGIYAYHNGEGDLTVEAYGQVTGESEDGIYAKNDDGDANNLKITTGAQSVVSGFKDGIDARNDGNGDFTIDVFGQVIGETGSGISARNGSAGPSDRDLKITTGAQSVVHGAEYGIEANSFADGGITITAFGQVTGESEDGIYAWSSGFSDYMTVIAGVGSVVAGGRDGIHAEHRGELDLTITANGQVTGQGTGEDPGSGIYAYNSAQGETIIAVGAAGLAQGDFAGISAKSDDSQIISITNDGLVRNLSEESDAQAIVTIGGATDVTNNANLLGTVTFDLDLDFDDKLTNDGFWNTANGTNEFGLGDEDEVNNTGTLIAADDETTAEVTRLNGLETFNNDGGLITMVDGQAGDQFNLGSEGSGALTYKSVGGRVAVDAVLGPGDEGVSDQLIINGTVNSDDGGPTTVAVNVVGATGANFDGIQVIVIENGTTVAGDFVLAGPLNAGFFTWDMRIDDLGGSWHELFTTGVGGGAFEFAAGITGAQDLWQQSINALLQRQADLKSLLGGTQVTPVADFADPVSPTPVAHVTPGFWFKGVGAYIERDDEEAGFVLDREQTVFGGLAGFDFGQENIGSQSDALMFGVFAGYLTSELDFKETNSEWTYEGPSVGVYASYVDSAFHLDATVKVDFLDIDIDPADLGAGSDANTDAVNIGGLIDTGYRFGHQLFIEPQASLAVVHTEIDDVDVFGGTVEFDDETSVSGRLGAKLGVAHTGSDATVYTSDVTASVWEDFSGDNDVSITDPVFGAFGASDDAGGTYGDVSLGFSMAAPEGWSGFIRGNYLFGEDFEAVSGNAGVRYVF